jgi:glycosyltransferase involved in cell wall biosynthesis
VALVNTRGNKVDRLHARHFAKANQVQIFTAKPPADFAHDLNRAAAWADLILSNWCDEGLAYLTSLPKPPPTVTFIRSYEILDPNLMRRIDWSKIKGIIFVSDQIRRLANEFWPIQIKEIPQATIHNFLHLEEQTVAGKRNGRNLCWIGYLGPKKGLELLFQCLMTALELHPDFRLHVAGTFQDKRYEVYVRHLLKDAGLEDKAVFHGWIDDMAAFLEGMDFLISSSPWEGCPNNVIEAMACGVMPLIHNWPGAKSLFPPELVFNALSDFRRILASPPVSPADCRNWVAEHFEAGRQLAKIENFVAMAIGK